MRPAGTQSGGLTDLQSKVLAMQNRERSRREENRARMPVIAAFVDSIKAEFGEGVKVLFAKENGYAVGTTQRHEWVNPILPYIPTEKPKKR